MKNRFRVAGCIGVILIIISLLFNMYVNESKEFIVCENLSKDNMVIKIPEVEIAKSRLDGEITIVDGLVVNILDEKVYSVEGYDLINAETITKSPLRRFLEKVEHTSSFLIINNNLLMLESIIGGALVIVFIVLLSYFLAKFIVSRRKAKVSMPNPVAFLVIVFITVLVYIYVPWSMYVFCRVYNGNRFSMLLLYIVLTCIIVPAVGLSILTRNAIEVDENDKPI